MPSLIYFASQLLRGQDPDILDKQMTFNNYLLEVKVQGLLISPAFFQLVYVLPL